MSSPLTPQELAQQDQLLALAKKTLDRLTFIAINGLAEDTRAELAHMLAVEINGEISPDLRTFLLTEAILQRAEEGSTDASHS